MKVYLVVDIVDLGYRAVVGFKDESKAIQRCNSLNEENRTLFNWFPFKDRCEVTSIEIEDM